MLFRSARSYFVSSHSVEPLDDRIFPRSSLRQGQSRRECSRFTSVPRYWAAPGAGRAESKVLPLLGPTRQGRMTLVGTPLGCLPKCNPQGRSTWVVASLVTRPQTGNHRDLAREHFEVAFLSLSPSTERSVPPNGQRSSPRRNPNHQFPRVWSLQPRATAAFHRQTTPQALIKYTDP